MIKSPAALARKRAYDKNYRLANHERIRTREREYYKKNATTILERQAEYRSGHKEAEAKRFKRYYAAHQDARVRSSRRWRAENRERHRAYQCEYAKAHEAEVRAYQMTWNRMHRPARRIVDMKKKYGMTEIQFDEMLNHQGGGCAICGETHWNSKGPQIDHDHKTGKVRGILCGGCNSALGFIKENPAVALAMIKYIKKHNPLPRVRGRVHAKRPRPGLVRLSGGE